MKTLFPAKLQDTNIIAIAIVMFGIVHIAITVANTQWGYFSSADRGEGIKVPLSLVQEFPLSDSTLSAILSGDPKKLEAVDSLPLPHALPSDEHSLSDWITIQYRKNVEVRQNLQGMKFAILSEIPTSELERVDIPYLSSPGVWSRASVFVDGVLVQEFTERSPLIAFPVQKSKNDVIKMVWIFTNSWPNKLAAFGGQTLPQIHSNREAYDAIQQRALAYHWPYLLAGIAFIVFGSLAIMLAMSGRSYVDLWAFAGSSIAFGLYAWSRTPMFYTSGISADYIQETRLSLLSFYIVSSLLMTGSFFRFPGSAISWRDLRSFRKLAFKDRPFAIPVMAASFAIVMLNLVYVLFKPFEPKAIWPYLSSVHALLQIVIFTYGCHRLRLLKKQFAQAQLAAQEMLLGKRLSTAIVFGICVLFTWIAQNSSGVIETDGSSNPKMVLSVTLPSFVMLLIFIRSVASANRFYARYAPRLNQIDHEILAFGEMALSKRFKGFLFVFDIAGMKALNELRSRDSSLEAAVDGLMTRIESELGELVQKGRVTLRYKSNGDEYIFAMWAKDEADAARELAGVLREWQEQASSIVSSWQRELEGMISSSDRSQPPVLDVHILACTLRSTKITIKGGIAQPTAAPDFIDPRFTRLSALFKPSRWNKIAMFADDARCLKELKGSFVAEKDGMGFWTFDVEEEKGNVA